MNYSVHGTARCGCTGVSHWLETSRSDLLHTGDTLRQNYMSQCPNLQFKAKGYKVLLCSLILLTIVKHLVDQDCSQLQGTWLRRNNEPEESILGIKFSLRTQYTSLTGVRCRSALTLTDELAHCLTSVKGIQLHIYTKYMFQTIGTRKATV